MFPFNHLPERCPAILRYSTNYPIDDISRIEGWSNANSYSYSTQRLPTTMAPNL
jgi:hypothetical protein